MMLQNQITFLIPSLICLDTALPYITELQRRKVGIHFVVDHQVRMLCKEELQGALSIMEMDQLDSRYDLEKLLHSFLRLAFTTKDFSPIYQRWLQQRLVGKSKISRVFAQLAILCGRKCALDRVNSRLNFWLGYIMRNPFITKKLIYITTTNKPHLLCGRGLEVYTIMESWDHPGKAPIGHTSSKVFVWNAALQQDWADFQGDTNLACAYPIKIAYAIGANNLRKGELLKPQNNRIMYPLTFGSTSDKQMFIEELRFIKELCVATEKAGVKLLIKPKPNSIDSGELNEFLEFTHVEVGRHQINQGGGHYRLSGHYNEQRLDELRKCDAVINLATTFAMDAAAFGLPVIQLEIECPVQYPLLSSLTEFPHLQRHLYCYQSSLFKLNDCALISQQLNFLSDSECYLQTARDFSMRLREWLIPDWSLEEAVRQVIDSCLQSEDFGDITLAASPVTSELI